VTELNKMFLDAFARARSSTVLDAGRTVDGQLVKLAGQAAPGPQGLLTSPLSGTPCVWYRSVSTPFTEPRRGSLGSPPRRATLPPVVPSSGFPIHKGSARREPEIQCPDSPFAVVDGDDCVVVDPHEAIVDTDVVTYTDFRRDESGWATALLREWVLPAGQPVIAFGVPKGTSNTSVAALRPDAAGTLIVATHTEQYLLNRSNTDTSLPIIKVIIGGGVLLGLIVIALILLVELRVI
jgi:hypothetical protein